jgi:hypothetical protein
MSHPKSKLKRPAWFDNRLALILGVLVLLIAVAARWNRAAALDPAIPSHPAAASLSQAEAEVPVNRQAAGLLPLDQTPTPLGTPIEPSRTPYPPELLSNRQQTIGISLVAALLVLIVAGGVFSVFLRDRDET